MNSLRRMSTNVSFKRVHNSQRNFVNSCIYDEAMPICHSAVLYCCGFHWKVKQIECCLKLKKMRQIFDLHRGLSRQIRQLFMSLKIGQSKMNKHKHRLSFEEFNKPVQNSFRKSTVYGIICIRRKVITRGFGCEKHDELSVYCKPSSDELLHAFGINSA